MRAYQAWQANEPMRTQRLKVITFWQLNARFHWFQINPGEPARPRSLAWNWGFSVSENVRIGSLSLFN